MSNDCVIQDSLGFLLADTARAIRKRFEQRGAEMGISAAQWRVLVQLVRTGPMAQARLAQLLEIEPISVSRMIDRMQDGGWVYRYAASDDRRCKLIDMTPKTRAAFADMRSIANDIYTEVLRDIPLEDLAVTRATLMRIQQNLSQPSETENDK